jgi:hypothetical protein
MPRTPVRTVKDHMWLPSRAFSACTMSRDVLGLKYTPSSPATHTTPPAAAITWGRGTDILACQIAARRAGGFAGTVGVGAIAARRRAGGSRMAVVRG